MQLHAGPNGLDVSNDGNGVIDRRPVAFTVCLPGAATSHGKNSTAPSEVGWWSNTRTTAKPVGVVGVGREVAARGALGGGSDSLHVPDLCEVLGVGHVLRQRAACLVDVGIDLVRRERRRVNRQAAADVAADLAHPHLLAVVAHRAQPEPQVVALVDVVARLLQREVLGPAEHVEVAHRCVRVALAGQRGCHHLHDRPRPLLLGWAPAATRERREGVVEAAHDHQIERIAVLRAILVGHAARQRLERRAKGGVIGVVRRSSRAGRSPA